jgi:hypothetical protein
LWLDTRHEEPSAEAREEFAGQLAGWSGVGEAAQEEVGEDCGRVAGDVGVLEELEFVGRRGGVDGHAGAAQEEFAVVG